MFFIQSYIIRQCTINMLNKSSKVLQFANVFLVVVLASSLMSTSYIKNSKAVVQEDEEPAYLKFASQAVKLSGNSTAGTTIIQLPEGAKGPPIPAKKGYLVQEIRDHLFWVTDGSWRSEQFMSTHCFSMAESGRVDPTVQALLQNSTFVYK